MQVLEVIARRVSRSTRRTWQWRGTTPRRCPAPLTDHRRRISNGKCPFLGSFRSRRSGFFQACWKTRRGGGGGNLWSKESPSPSSLLPQRSLLNGHSTLYLYLPPLHSQRNLPKIYSRTKSFRNPRRILKDPLAMFKRNLSYEKRKDGLKIVISFPENLKRIFEAPLKKRRKSSMKNPEGFSHTKKMSWKNPKILWLCLRASLKRFKGDPLRDIFKDFPKSSLNNA